MSIDANVAFVETHEDGSGVLHLCDRDKNGSRGQSRLHYRTAPYEVTALNGLPIWGGDSTIMLGDREIAKREGYTRISFSEREQFLAAVAAFHQRQRDEPDRGARAMSEPLDLDALELDTHNVACVHWTPAVARALIARLRAAEQTRDGLREQLQVQMALKAEYLTAADTWSERTTSAEAERDALQARATKAEQELAAIHASRQRIRDSFHCRHDAWCQCPYCRGDADDLAELAADYECQLYAATQKPDQLTALAEGLAQSGTRLEFKAEDVKA